MIDKITQYIKSIDNNQYEYGVILGSGWSHVVDIINIKHEIHYSDIPGYPTCSVKGHDGKMILGEINGKNVILLVGRFHLYEGYEIQKVVTPIHVLHALGVKTLILTNASGGINKKYKPGDIMIISDHINNTSQNPLTGLTATTERPIFIDTSTIYRQEYIALAERICNRHKIRHHKGTYIQNIGPSYETPAEIRAMGKIGADAVGMSTVVEALTAHYLGISVIGLSHITNMAPGISKNKITHQEVLDIANKNKNLLSKMLYDLISEL